MDPNIFIDLFYAYTCLIYSQLLVKQTDVTILVAKSMLISLSDQVIVSKREHMHTQLSYK